MVVRELGASSHVWPTRKLRLLVKGLVRNAQMHVSLFPLGIVNAIPGRTLFVCVPPVALPPKSHHAGMCDLGDCTTSGNKLKKPASKLPLRRAFHPRYHSNCAFAPLRDSIKSVALTRRHGIPYLLSCLCSAEVSGHQLGSDTSIDISAAGSHHPPAL